jgi:hypothetical protein
MRLVHFEKYFRPQLSSTVSPQRYIKMKTRPIFHITENSNEMIIRRTNIPPKYFSNLLWYFLVLFICWGSGFNPTNILIVAIIFIVFPLLSWHVIPKYPSVVHISLGCISARFFRILLFNRIITITAGHYPSIVIGSYLQKDRKPIYQAKVQLLSIGNPPIVIYEESFSTKEQGLKLAEHISLSVSNRTGFPIKDKNRFIGCGLTSRSS